MIGELAAAPEDSFPILLALGFREVDLRNGAEELPKQSSSDRPVEAFERLNQEIEEGIFSRRLKLPRFAGLGHHLEGFAGQGHHRFPMLPKNLSCPGASKFRRKKVEPLAPDRPTPAIEPRPRMACKLLQRLKLLKSRGRVNAKVIMASGTIGKRSPLGAPIALTEQRGEEKILANWLQKRNAHQMHIPGLLLSLHSGKDRRHAGRNQSGGGNRGSWNRQRNHLTDRQRPG